MWILGQGIAWISWKLVWISRAKLCSISWWIFLGWRISGLNIRWWIFALNIPCWIFVFKILIIIISYVRLWIFWKLSVDIISIWLRLAVDISCLYLWWILLRSLRDIFHHGIFESLTLVWDIASICLGCWGTSISLIPRPFRPLGDIAASWKPRPSPSPPQRWGAGGWQRSARRDVTRPCHAVDSPIPNPRGARSPQPPPSLISFGPPPSGSYRSCPAKGPPNHASVDSPPRRSLFCPPETPPPCCWPLPPHRSCPSPFPGQYPCPPLHPFP